VISRRDCFQHRYVRSPQQRSAGYGKSARAQDLGLYGDALCRAGHLRGLWGDELVCLRRFGGHARYRRIVSCRTSSRGHRRLDPCLWPTVAVLWIAVRMAGRELSEYLDLNWPRRNELIEALIIVAILWILEIATTSAVEPVDLSGAYGGVGGIFLLFVALTITGPIVEEFLCRGFMFRGWSQSFLGPAGAIVLISAIWAATHVDQSWWARIWIFVSGLALGYFRWRSHSTWLASSATRPSMCWPSLRLGGRVRTSSPSRLRPAS
jgi:Type II CAAX prenyl endopeptidase Rce1-like